MHLTLHGDSQDWPGPEASWFVAFEYNWRCSLWEDSNPWPEYL